MMLKMVGFYTCCNDILRPPQDTHELLQIRPYPHSFNEMIFYVIVSSYYLLFLLSRVSYA